MGWLDERLIKYLYSNDKEEIIIEAPAGGEIPPAPKGYKYKGFAPDKTYIMTRVQFEQNGRIGYRIDVGDGKQLYRSATREQYEHKVGNIGADRYKEAKRQGEDLKINDSVYAKAYGEKVKEAEKKKTEKFQRGLKKILKGGK